MLFGARQSMDRLPSPRHCFMERGSKHSKRHREMNGEGGLRDALALVAGVGLGAAAVQGLHAQAKPKAYLVTETEVLDPAALSAYLSQVREAVKPAGGNVDFVAPTEKIHAVVGDAPKRVGVSEWESLDKVKAWIDAPERKALAPQREKAQRITRQFIIERK